MVLRSMLRLPTLVQWRSSRTMTSRKTTHTGTSRSSLVTLPQQKEYLTHLYRYDPKELFLWRTKSEEGLPLTVINLSPSVSMRLTLLKYSFLLNILLLAGILLSLTGSQVIK